MFPPGVYGVMLISCVISHAQGCVASISCGIANGYIWFIGLNKSPAMRECLCGC